MRKQTIPTKAELKAIRGAGKDIAFEEWMALEHGVRINSEFWTNGITMEDWLKRAGYLEGWKHGGYESEEDAVITKIDNLYDAYRDFINS